MARNAPVAHKVIATIWPDGGGAICDSYKPIRRGLPRDSLDPPLPEMLAAPWAPRMTRPGKTLSALDYSSAPIAAIPSIRKTGGEQHPLRIHQ